MFKVVLNCVKKDYMILFDLIFAYKPPGRMLQKLVFLIQAISQTCKNYISLSSTSILDWLWSGWKREGIFLHRKFVYQLKREVL